MDKIIPIRIIPVIDKEVRNLCFKAYPNHPKGCPNFNKRTNCPPKAPLWEDICDLGLATWLMWTKFDLGSHRERMKTKHPNWSRRQLDCCLYWQNTARKPLKNFIKTKWLMPGFFKTTCPEAMGINVTETMGQIGIKLEWPPEKWTYQVAMGGWLK